MNTLKYIINKENEHANIANIRNEIILFLYNLLQELVMLAILSCNVFIYLHNMHEIVFNSN